MTQYPAVAYKVNRGMERIGEQLEEFGQPMKGKFFRSPAVRDRVAGFVGDHPYWAASILIAGLGTYLYYRFRD